MPSRQIHGPCFRPTSSIRAENTLAFSDDLIGVLPFFAPAYALTGNPIFAYNVVFIAVVSLVGTFDVPPRSSLDAQLLGLAARGRAVRLCADSLWGAQPSAAAKSLLDPPGIPVFWTDSCMANDGWIPGSAWLCLTGYRCCFSVYLWGGSQRSLPWP